jgi:hypothetical protein
MSDKYNGWTNYATWRVNLEMIDGLDPKDMCWDKMDRFDLKDALRTYCDEMLLETCPEGGLAFEYAQVFFSDVNWLEIADSMIDDYPDYFDPNPFKVVGVDENDGTTTVLEEFDNSAEAKAWAREYVSKENAGGWKQVCVDDRREECAETIWKWEAQEQEA